MSDKFRVKRYSPPTDTAHDKNAEKTAVAVINQCKQYDFQVYTIHLSEYVQSHTTLPEPNCVPKNKNEMELQALLSSMSVTVGNDFFMKIKTNLFIRVAKQLQCNYIFTAETTATLAINLLSNLTMGRGEQVQDDVSFYDGRNDRIKILRPMKDISKEELDYYIRMKNLHPAEQSIIQPNSLQSVIGSFVTELQGSFPATISTICKTADKIGTSNTDQSKEKCVLCKSFLRTQSTKLTALEATNFSRVVSLQSPNNTDLKTIEHQVNCSNEKSMFPYVNDRLCYGCSRNYLEINNSTLPRHIHDAILS
ncbi:cytoplasmic tRNA 2-thiolation protein 2 [Leguminivora glycinivorella]|uniref:cytoplasmic tRNA 2-thiolation protein 2 n=1 Tax=Leguminivora glycinivorella TaxID=1035111 RepID=UPI00200CB637|nr:cytoplasmic tRNA 2-thiolation protein 2 [Leguminivora glycinivorella]